jgi:hypothetical protein
MDTGYRFHRDNLALPLLLGSQWLIVLSLKFQAQGD